MRYFIFLFLFSLSFGSYAQHGTVGRQNHHTPTVADKVAMYEVFVMNFSKEGNFKAVTARLKDIKALGANTIWLMPIQPIGVEKHKGTYGSPYAIKDYTDVNPNYGTKADFKQLVDSCHAMNMNIIIDLVADHTSWDNAWVKDHPDWYKHDDKGNIVSPVADWSDVAGLNFDNKAMRSEMIKDIMYWVREFDIDGYRCDAASMMPVDFWKEAIDSITKVKYAIMLAESDDPKLYNAGFQMTYGWEFYNMLKKVFKGEKPAAKLDSVLDDEKKRFPPSALQLRFITNHDEDSWDNVPAVLFGGIEGSEAAFVIMDCLPGIPLIYNGQEVAYPTKINLFEKYVINYNTNPQLKRFYTLMMSLHRGSAAIRSGDLKSIDVSNKDVYAFIRSKGKERILVCVNVSNKEVKYAKPAVITPASRYVLGVKAGTDAAVQTLPPYGYQIIKL